jgi:hypothetical protein
MASERVEKGMGQRHQIYVALSKKHPDVQKGEKRVIGIHSQWLYGHTAARLCERFLKFIIMGKSQRADHCGDYSPFVCGDGNETEVLKSIYGCDPANGYFQKLYNLEDGEPEDPRLGDNNDGITVFDLRRLTGNRGRIGYCFVSFGHKGLPEMKPLSARQYVRAYYPEEVDEVRIPGFKVCRKPNGEKNDPENRVRAVERLRVPVMTEKDLHEIWPKVFPQPAAQARAHQNRRRPRRADRIPQATQVDSHEHRRTWLIQPT